MTRGGAVLSLILLATRSAPVAAAAQDLQVASRAPRFMAAGATRELAPAAAEFAVLRRRVTLALDSVSLDHALKAIVKQAGLEITYSRSVLPDRPVSLHAQGITVAAALTEVLLGLDVDVSVAQTGHLALVRRSSATRRTQAGSVTGKVTDAKTGLGVASAEVFLEGTRWRAVADTAGNYRIAAVDTGVYVLVARRVGYTKQSRRVTVHAERDDTVNVALEPKAVPLEELVTTATGRQRRRDLGNAITTINADSVLQHAPIKSLTDLLEDRVPGLTTQHTSGAPGDPARLRLRGLGSALRSNDPVVVVDGVRVYAAQSEARSGNLANRNAAAPSPLDQIDPNIIEKIEVFKGPSAATLYGADAANGVIVITTKRGKPGPTRWDARVTQSQEATASRYPTGYYRFGHDSLGSDPKFCTLLDRFCVQDSLVQFQALNEPSVTPIGGHGQRTSLSLTASGGTQALTYSITGSYSNEIGLLRLPAFEVQRFQSAFNRPAPDWMQRPHRYMQWDVTSNVTARLGPTADVTLMTSLSRSEQQRSSLEGQLGQLAGTYVDTVNGLYYRPGTGPTFGQLSPIAEIYNVGSDYYARTRASGITFTTGVSSNWHPRPWFTASGQAGLNIIPRDDELLLPAGLVTPTDSGQVIRGTGRSIVSTVNVQGTLRKPLRAGFAFETSVGANLLGTNTADLYTAASRLVPGTSSISGAREIQASDARASTSVYGWYVEPRLTGQRIALSTGLRLDGGSAYGTRVSGFGGGGRGFLRGLLALPKLNGSWVISEEPWFPFKTLVSSLRLRGAYGQAQVQPGPADRLRLYTGTTDPLGSVSLTSLGNTRLRPERSTEIEGGFDADLLEGRLSVELTGYRKLQVDALMRVTLPGSVYGGPSVLENIGNVLNRGVELSLNVTPVRASLATWSLQWHYSRNHNELTQLGPGVDPNYQDGLVAGYPVGSRWELPIIGFADQNGDGIIQRREIQVGDSMVYMGRLYPAYTMAMFSNVALWGGTVGITAGFSYDAGATQVDQLASNNWVLTRALFDPSAPLGEQAAVVAYQSLQSDNNAANTSVEVSPATEYGLIQSVSTFRFNSLSVNYRAPARVARLLRAQQLTLALQGSNLGWHSTYRGRDPDVNAWGPGENILDTGQLALPRTWQLAVFLSY